MNEPAYHVPALLMATIDGLNIRSGGVYVDCTFGGGGHAREMLSRLGEQGKLLGFDQGADDYIVKPFEFRELLARIKALLKRVQPDPKSQRVLRVADLEIDLDSKTVKRGNISIDLTAKEFLLLEFLVRNKGKVVSKADIAENIWNITFDTGTNVIEVYVNFLRKKIDKNYPVKLIHTHIGMGYILKADDDANQN